MQIQVNTDRNIAGSEGLSRKLEASIEQALGRFVDQITRVEVHLSDENSTAKSGTADKRCLLEVRLAGRQPTSVSADGATIEDAVHDAARKMIRSLESTLGKLASD